MSKNRTPSRQVRRAAERRKAKQLEKKEREQTGNQKQEEPQELDEPKRKKIDWKSISSIIAVFLKVAEFIRDTILKLL